jgi:hypothetical protein
LDPAELPVPKQIPLLLLVTISILFPDALLLSETRSKSRLHDTVYDGIFAIVLFDIIFEFELRDNKIAAYAP